MVLPRSRIAAASSGPPGAARALGRASGLQLGASLLPVPTLSVRLRQLHRRRAILRFRNVVNLGAWAVGLATLAILAGTSLVTLR